MDNDLIVLEDAAAAIMSMDRKYRRANFNEKLKLKSQRNKAFNAYAKARLNLLEEGVITTAQDIKEMNAIRQEIARARKTQSILTGIGRFVKFLVKL